MVGVFCILKFGKLRLINNFNKFIMAKVKKTFFCIKEKKTYYVGDEYKGSRKDLSHVLEMEDKSIVPKTSKKAKRKTKR